MFHNKMMIGLPGKTEKLSPIYTHWNFLAGVVNRY